MSDNGENTVTSIGEREHHEESLMERIADKFHHHDDSSSSSSSSSSDSEDEKKEKKKGKEKEDEVFKTEEVKAKVNRLFGREKPVHEVLGGGKPADVLLWRNKKISASVLGTATVIWILFELLQYHLLTLVCHTLIFSLAVLFLWANASTLIHKSPPRVPEVLLPVEPFVEFATALRFEINRGLYYLREIASGRELKKFLGVIAGLWILSILGNCCNFLTLFYIVFVLLHTLPVLYEKHEDKVDPFAEKALHEAKRHYGVIDEKYLRKIPKVLLKGKKAE